MNKQTIIIKANNGIDATPIAHLVQTASNFDSSIYFEFQNKKINAKSIMGMMILTLEEGVELTITATGSDEEQAVEKMAQAIHTLCS